MTKQLMNNGLEGYERKHLWHNLKYYEHFPGGTEETIQNFS
jgi:hypothetical protein